MIRSHTSITQREARLGAGIQKLQNNMANSLYNESVFCYHISCCGLLAFTIGNILSQMSFAAAEVTAGLLKKASPKKGE